jgi:hypothetical protein
LCNGGGIVPAREVSSYADHALDVGDEADVGGQLERAGEEAASVLHLPLLGIGHRKIGKDGRPNGDECGVDPAERVLDDQSGLPRIAEELGDMFLIPIQRPAYTTYCARYSLEWR